MDDIENYTSLQEFTEDISSRGNKPILHNHSAQGLKRGADCLRGQTAIFVLIGLLASVCANIALSVLLFSRPFPSVPLETAAMALELKSVQGRFVHLCNDYTNLSQNCSKTVRKCRECPEGWIHIYEKCYYFSKDKLDWMSSKDSCTSMGSHLTILHSKEQHDALEKEARRIGGFEYHFWIGLSDLEKEGDWRWVDNTALTNTYWNELSSQPDNHQSGGLHGEDCATLDSHSQTWFDLINKMEVEQLLSLSGPALAQAVSTLLETPGLYVFSDILELPNVRELETGPHAPVYQLLNLFAYGTYCDYKERAASLPELTPAQRNKLRHLSIISLASNLKVQGNFSPRVDPAQRNKLRHLSIISLASNLKCLPYSLLLQQLELKNVRELEDLLIEAVYCDIIQGKLDQRNQQVEVDCSVGRDLGPNELPNIANTLQEWCSGCEAVLCGIEEQVSRANLYRESQLKVKVQVETEVSNLQKTIKASSASPSSGPAAAGVASNQDADQPAEPRDPASSQEPRQPGKKSSKVKGLRGSGKIWSKSN
ncbi:hypothetical protein UPYG_G00145700 [Umbra pygmaea]|uniref:Uncharacterized protein n=1 Tax=Umbra pygmaea TaxID=75934 RepID=A0ABD0WW88_UMBPY